MKMVCHFMLIDGVNPITAGIQSEAHIPQKKRLTESQPPINAFVRYDYTFRRLEFKACL